MKKLILVIALLIGFSTFVGAQSRGGIYTVESYSDTISGAETHNYTFDQFRLLQPYLFGAMIYSDHISGSTDSAYAYLQASFDGTNYFTVKSAATASTKFGATDAAVNLYSSASTDVWFYPYLRVSITHYATGTARYSIKLWLMTP